ncbi:hypothetical protein PHYSODRAFT_343358, partial [Phytophthora sojae]
MEMQTALQSPAEDELIKSDKKCCGVGGFYDFGPPACALKSNLLQFWRRHFVFADKLLE